ncbi:MAG: hypothetical protein AAAC47_18950, partial [Pararhizobium sp.]
VTYVYFIRDGFQCPLPKWFFFETTAAIRAGRFWAAGRGAGIPGRIGLSIMRVSHGSHAKRLSCLSGAASQHGLL